VTLLFRCTPKANAAIINTVIAKILRCLLMVREILPYLRSGAMLILTFLWR